MPLAVFAQRSLHSLVASAACGRQLPLKIWVRHFLPVLLPMQGGQYILRENDALATNAKFYMIESGLVECQRTFEVGR